MLSKRDQWQVQCNAGNARYSFDFEVRHINQQCSS